MFGGMLKAYYLSCMNNEISQKNNLAGMHSAAELLAKIKNVVQDQKLTLDGLYDITPFSKGYLSTLLKTTNCPLTTACILANALGYELKLVKKDEKI